MKEWNNNVGVACGYSILHFYVSSDISRTDSTFDNNCDRGCMCVLHIRNVWFPTNSHGKLVFLGLGEENISENSLTDNLNNVNFKIGTINTKRELYPKYPKNTSKTVLKTKSVYTRMMFLSFRHQFWTCFKNGSDYEIYYEIFMQNIDSKWKRWY